MEPIIPMSLHQPEKMESEETRRAAWSLYLDMVTHEQMSTDLETWKLHEPKPRMRTLEKKLTRALQIPNVTMLCFSVASDNRVRAGTSRFRELKDMLWFFDTRNPNTEVIIPNFELASGRKSSYLQLQQVQNWQLSST